MDHYIDIQIQPDDEMRENVLLNKVYSKLHKALFSLKANDIGVSFPEYRVKLGRTLRLHSTASRLTELQQLNWLGGLSGYCKNTAIQPIPAHVMYRTVSRIQATMTQAKLNRLIKRGTITEDRVKQYKAKMYGRGLDNPYLELESTSNGHQHRRYLAFGERCEISSLGEFDYFGLSKTATIPCF
jgi:CRISPR-associated endonuclease Csy4